MYGNIAFSIVSISVVAFISSHLCLKDFVYIVSFFVCSASFFLYRVFMKNCVFIFKKFKIVQPLLSQHLTVISLS